MTENELLDRTQELQARLEALLGSSNVYFQAPPNTGMQYPCILYKRDSQRTLFANNGPYRRTQRWQLIVIDKDPNTPVLNEIAKLPLCAFDRFYTADNLNHDVYTLFF